MQVTSKMNGSTIIIIMDFYWNYENLLAKNKKQMNFKSTSKVYSFKKRKKMGLQLL